MDQHRMLTLTRALARVPSRRDVLRGLIGPGLGLGSFRLSNVAGTKNRGKRKKKITRNAFGCVSVGGFCKSSEQCCSGICQGKKGKKTCRAHDTGGCQGEAGQDRCLDVKINCVTGIGIDGFCVRTTGNAGYCEGALRCFACTKDADCIPFCGPQAACIVCSGCTDQVGTDTACVGPSNGSCEFPE
jgi:hypothetical protein